MRAHRCAALNWWFRHQSSDGSWSLEHYPQHCKDKTCTGPGHLHADAGATALALLPFLARGLTHKCRSPYRSNIEAGVMWLLEHQKPDGDLASDDSCKMRCHGLATLALCECYGMSRDRVVGKAAQER